MPQMFPLLWLNIFLILMIILTIMIMENHFSQKKSMSKSFSSKIKLQSFNWLW